MKEPYLNSVDERYLYEWIGNLEEYERTTGKSIKDDDPSEVDVLFVLIDNIKL